VSALSSLQTLSPPQKAFLAVPQMQLFVKGAVQIPQQEPILMFKSWQYRPSPQITFLTTPQAHKVPKFSVQLSWQLEVVTVLIGACFLSTNASV
jgi:hypothetical protein